jgi:BolA protein
MTSQERTGENSRAHALEQRLRDNLTVGRLAVEDQSHMHAGHAGAKDGKSHFHIVISAAEFAGKSVIQRHKLVYSAVGDLMATDIHALSIEAVTPDAGSTASPDS